MGKPFCTIAEALAELKAGRFIVLVDDEHRENEGDLVCAAECITPEMVNFMLIHARGVLCVALPRNRCRELDLQPQAVENTAALQTAFTVTIDAQGRFGVTTGVSAKDRCTTIRRLACLEAMADDFARPGHINPLMARDGGVLVRAGQTEGTVDLLRLAGMQPVGALIEIMNDDGTMARVPDLIRFCERHGIRMCTNADLIEYRQQRESLIQRVEVVQMPTRYGRFKLHAYKSLVDPELHLALCCGSVGEPDDQGQVIQHHDPILVRVHSECFTGDVFGSQRCDCGEQLRDAMTMIQAAGKGAIVYLRQEGRGIGLHNKLRAYHLQENGFDTVEANEELGFPADKRDYGIGAQIIRDLGLRNIRVLTNNPKKISRLSVYGLNVVEQIPIRIPPNDANRAYLRTKREKMGHLLDADET
ncbi:MAG TPA: bifunctional 3,4-dihydroxy-2-butanone-4-phosphate synthase/GTP cyclohydrolase II [Phycisphaerae bacterium]|nr:bifunctional 3,4-dihydroxy-2-butanone-4-phosphate synthase/GTP cyclohydrolase II [Phycisphaerae bacterium]HRY70183.1 bifunctional 3,4-dihydroxy-2-butanone-4-phosphate synthase/GTP cyclohydrolase II [Phycisphaerae bacterium]HSA27398.1 bifunctional 3,4-dihydroxy-2-butanone-4-phosphate synthase/GTP cyclohydrolase II [Phycisphaerae bacterium]